MTRMRTTRVRVIRSHVLGVNRYAEVGDVLDLPDAVAIERIHNGSVEPAPPEPAPEAPEGAEGEADPGDPTAGGTEHTDDAGDEEGSVEASGSGETDDTTGQRARRGSGRKEKGK